MVKKKDSFLDVVKFHSYEINSRGLTTPKVAGSRIIRNLKKVILPHRTYAVKSIGSYSKTKECRD